MVQIALQFQDTLAVDVVNMSDADDENSNKHGNQVKKILAVEGEIRDRWPKVAPCDVTDQVFLNSNIFLNTETQDDKNGRT